jgi:hypothetical protein
MPESLDVVITPEMEEELNAMGKGADAPKEDKEEE